MTPRATGAFRPYGHFRRKDAIPVFPQGRICAHLGCETLLSIYNRAPLCSLHVAERTAESRRPASHGPLEERRCENCGEVFTTNNPTRRYCNDHCRMAAWASRGRGKSDAA